MKKILGSVSDKQLLWLGVFMAIMPVIPEPHLYEKAKMLFKGTLTRFIDVFDIFWHTLPFSFLIFKKVVYKYKMKKNS